MASEFAVTIRNWRGRLYQKEAAAILGVSLRAYQSWEQGEHQPVKSHKELLKQKMAERVPPYGHCASNVGSA